MNSCRLRASGDAGGALADLLACSLQLEGVPRVFRTAGGFMKRNLQHPRVRIPYPAPQNASEPPRSVHAPGGTRRSERSPLYIPATALLLLFLTPGGLAGYIDPISGSIILQVLAAAALGTLLTVKRVWTRVTGVFWAIWEGVRHRWRR